MFKYFTSLTFLSIVLSFKAQAQIPNGSVAPDITLTDLDGNTYNLHDLLESGKTIYIDLFATWCGPCWAYKNTGILEDLDTQYGPNGTDEVRVFYVEGESSNTLAQLQGTTTSQTTAGFTQGDWISSISSPIIDDASVADAFNISGFPTVFMICPSTKRVMDISPSEVGVIPTATLKQMGDDCILESDSRLVNYTGELSTCSSLPLELNIENKGASPLTNATITATVNGTEVASLDWTGSLEQFQSEEVSLGNYTPVAQDQVTFTITAASDAQGNNNSINKTISKAPVVSISKLTVAVTTDRYGSEVRWRLRKGNNQVVLSGGPYTDQSSNGSYPQVEKTYNLPIGAVECYKFEITDDFGDGICCGYGDGKFEVKDENGTVLVDGNGQYEAIDKRSIDATSTSTASIGDVIQNEQFKVYPNPSNGTIHATFTVSTVSDITISISNASGQQIISEKKQLMPGEYFIPFDLSNYANGLYFVSLSTIEGAIQTKVNILK